jgi:ssDNA thymidine ADP-ribosyltransferase, DarT
MSIATEAKVKFQLAPAFHFTLSENLPEILQAGCLFSKATVGQRMKADLSNPEIQKARDTRAIPATGRRVSEYVPLYFGFKTPMLSLKRKQNEDIIYLRFSLDILGISGAVFSDGNASDRDTTFSAFQKVDDLAVLDHATINGVKWEGTDLDKKRRKQSEILIPDS